MCYSVLVLYYSLDIIHAITDIGLTNMHFQEFKIENLEQFPKDLESMLAKQLATIDEITKNDDFF